MLSEQLQVKGHTKNAANLHKSITQCDSQCDSECDSECDSYSKTIVKHTITIRLTAGNGIRNFFRFSGGSSSEDFLFKEVRLVFFTSLVCLWSAYES